MFRFRFGLGPKDKDSEQAFVSPPPLRLDLAALKKSEAERSRRTQEALSRGQLPPDALARLQSQRSGELPWTSDLSVNEWLAVRRYGLRPLGQVMGSSFYHVGYAFSGTTSLGYGGYRMSSRELDAPTRALYEGRELALSRMRQEAAALGANAVVGVHLDQKGYDAEAGLVEYACFGTAVRVDGLETPQEPIISSVSGQDFVRLLAADALPVGLALGASFYYLRTDWMDLRQERSWYNREMTHFQQGLQWARHYALRRMKEDIQRLGGDGVVGVEFQLRTEEVAGGSTDDGEEIVDHLIEAVLFGTAVARLGREPVRFSGRAVLDLRG